MFWRPIPFICTWGACCNYCNNVVSNLTRVTVCCGKYNWKTREDNNKPRISYQYIEHLENMLNYNVHKMFITYFVLLFRRTGLQIIFRLWKSAKQSNKALPGGPPKRTFARFCWWYGIDGPTGNKACKYDKIMEQINKDALLLWQITRDLLHALSHRHDYTWTTFVKPVISIGGNKLITCW